MKRDNLVGWWRLFKQSQEGCTAAQFGKEEHAPLAASLVGSEHLECQMVNQLSFFLQESFKFYADKLKERADKAQMRAEE